MSDGFQLIEISLDDANAQFTIGRNRDSNLCLNSKYVSHRHGVITKTAQGFLYENLSETSGTECNGTPIEKKLLEDNDLLVIGMERLGVTIRKNSMSLILLNSDSEAPLQIFEGKWTLLGRHAPAKDAVISHPGCPAILSKVQKKNGNAEIVFERKARDAESNAFKKIVLKDSEKVSLPWCTFEMQNGQFFLRKSKPGFSVQVKNLTAYAGKKQLLRNINFSLPAGQILAVIGRSGQGKSSLLRLMLGTLRAGENSEVLLNGIPHRNPDIQKYTAFLAQDPELREDLTVSETLLMASKITLPKDTTEEERESRKKDLLELLALNRLTDSKISTLSGGEKRRAALAAELIGSPGLILLDEPLSGLDPVNVRTLCHHLRKLSILGYTIILTTHGYEALDIAHKVLVIHDGAEAFFGTPKEATLFFETESADKALWKLKDSSTDFWECSAFRKRIAEEQEATTKTLFPKIQKPSPFKIYNTLLVKQYFRDKGRILALCVQPLIIGFLFSQTFSAKSSLWVAAFALVLSANWFALSLSIRGIVQERKILRLELRKGAPAFSILSAKLLFVTIFSFIQTFVCYGFLAFVLPIAPNFPLLALSIFVSVLPAATLGFLVSSLSKNPGQANAMLPLLIIPQVALAGALVPIDQMRPIGRAASTFIASKFNLEALKALFLNENLTCSDIAFPLLLTFIFYIVALRTLHSLGKAK